MNPALLLQHFDRISEVNELRTLDDQREREEIRRCLLKAVLYPPQ